MDFEVQERYISLLANHFKVSIKNPYEIFYQYIVCYRVIKSVSILLKNMHIMGKRLFIMGKNMHIMRKRQSNWEQSFREKTCWKTLPKHTHQKFLVKKYAHNGEKTLYNVGHLPQNEFKSMVVLEDSFGKRFVTLVINSSSFDILEVF